MSLSDRERRILAEIEQDLRWQDRDFACRIDALNAKPARRRCPVNRRDVAFIVIIVIAMSLLSAVVFVAAGRPRTQPPPTVRPTRDVITTSPQVTPR